MADVPANPARPRCRADAVPGFALRFLLIAAVLSMPAAREAQFLARALLPLFESELAHLDPTFRIERLSLDKDGPDPVLRVEVGLARALTLNGRTFYPDPRGRAMASTLVGNLTLPCVLLIATVLAWPVREVRLWAVRILALLPALLALCMLGAPFILWAELWGVVLSSADPNRFSPLVVWGDFLLGGGQFALALALGAAIATIGAPSLRSPHP